MPPTARNRKIQGSKFLFTLPYDWREAHRMAPGQIVTAHYQGASPLVMVPKGMQLSPLEENLISLLVEGPSTKRMLEFKAQVDALSSELGKIVEVSCVVG